MWGIYRWNSGRDCAGRAAQPTARYNYISYGADSETRAPYFHSIAESRPNYETPPQ